MPILKNLVISGGGLNGIAYLGIIKYLEEHKLLNNITHYIGTSIGGVICYLLTINYSSNELYNFCKYFNFKQVIDKINIDNFINYYGLLDSNILKIVLKNLSKAKNIDFNITFQEHFNLTKKKITVCGCCLNNFKSYFFNYENTPDMKILDALLISSAIPLVFKPIEYNDKLWLDGGITNNYPFDYCDDIKNTLGICVYTSCLDDCKIKKGIDLFEYLSQVFNYISFSDCIKNVNKYKKNTIKYYISNDLIPNFNISKNDIEIMMDKGYNTIVNQHYILEQFINK